MDFDDPGGLLAGRYRLRDVIGRGGMGVVWRATDELLGRDVAVKEILWPPQLEADEREALRHRALREARTAARLNHPNIVGIYDVAEDGGRPWIVMQLVPYRSLSDAVADDGPLPPARAARIGLQILAALRAAHAIGVLHRDVKPGNVLVGPSDQVVLTDFGMAVAGGSPTLTTSGVVIGSPSYMAPERARGEQATTAADMWSLGATLYAAVEGRPPFDRDGTLAVLTAVVNDNPDPASRAGPLGPLITGLLRKDPAARPGAAEAERLLHHVVAGQGAAPDTLPHEARSRLGEEHASIEPARQRSAAVTAAATTQPQPHVSTTASTGPLPPLIPGMEPRQDVPPRPRQPEPAPPGGSAWRRHPRLRWLSAAAAAAVAAIAVAVGVASQGSSGHHASAPAASRSSGTHTGQQPGTPTPAPSHPGSTPPSGSGAGPLPAGFAWHRDPTGFSIGVPAGWQVSHQGHLVYVRDPSGSRFLIIDQSDHPKPDPLADWRQQEASRISTYPGYHRIRLAAVHYAQAERAADWEFTYYLNGQLTHVLNRNILANARHAYALYWSTPASEWDGSFHLFQAFASTFRPAP